MAWLYLLGAAAFEIVFAVSMKYAQGFTQLVPAVTTIVAAMISIAMLTMAMRDLPVSIAYPIWTAVGTLGTVVFGYYFLNEPLTFTKAVSAIAIVGGVIGLKVSAA